MRSKELTPMTEHTLPLITFYQGWQTYQHSLVETIAPLPREQLALPVAPHHWSIGQLLNHMVSDRVWWFHLWMEEGDPDLAPVAQWGEEGQPTRSAAELLAALEAGWQMIENALASWTAADLGHVFSPPASLSGKEKSAFGERTLQWILWHVLEHEIHHGGELSLALGGLGLQGVYGNA